MAIWLKIKQYVLAVVAALGAIIGVYLYGRQQGSLKAQQKAAERDRDNARRIEDAADKARTNTGDAIDRLQQHGNLRD